MTTRKISTLHNWDKNPRSITKNGLERLKKQITKLGQYKPLLITEDGTVLGGNMRLRAYQELGIQDIWVSVVDAPTEEKKIEYALSDNDRAGKYELDQISDLIGNFPEVEWKNYSVDTLDPINIENLMSQFDPNKEWENMPEFNQDGIDCYKELTVRFLKKEDYEKFANLINQKLTEKTKAIWYPPQSFNTTGNGLTFNNES